MHGRICIDAKNDLLVTKLRTDAKCSTRLNLEVFDVLGVKHAKLLDG